jgi:hypothetical protein
MQTYKKATSLILIRLESLVYFMYFLYVYFHQKIGCPSLKGLSHDIFTFLKACMDLI